MPWPGVCSSRRLQIALKINTGRVTACTASTTTPRSGLRRNTPPTKCTAVEGSQHQKAPRARPTRGEQAPRCVACLQSSRSCRTSTSPTSWVGRSIITQSNPVAMEPPKAASGRVLPGTGEREGCDEAQGDVRPQETPPFGNTG